MEYDPLPHLKELTTLCRVADLSSITEAARQLGVGQPAISKRLQSLEATYGMPLLERQGGRVKLTVAGEKVYQFAEQSLKRHSALREELNLLARGQQLLRLEVTFAIGEHLLPQLLVLFSQKYAHYKIISRLAYSRQIQSHLATGLADLGLLESIPEHPDILMQKWIDDELWLVCGQHHALTATPSIELTDLPQLSFILREAKSSVREVLMENLAQFQIGPLNIAMEVGSSNTIVDILGRGDHVSFLPRFSVAKAVQQGLLKHIEVNGFKAKRTLWIARHTDNLHHPVADAFIQVLRNAPIK